MGVKKSFALRASPTDSEGEGSVIIYKATNRITKHAYIGQTPKPLGVRRSEHEKQALKMMAPDNQGKLFGPEKRAGNYCLNFCAAMMKWGIEAFDWEILERVPQAMADDAETKAIRRHDTLNPNGYNLELGGKTGFFERAAKPGKKPVAFRSDIRTDDIVRMHKAGMSRTAIARKLGCGEGIVRGRLKRRGM